MYTPTQAISFARQAIESSSVQTTTAKDANPVHDAAIGQLQKACNPSISLAMTNDFAKSLFSSVYLVLQQSKIREASINASDSKVYKTYMDYVSERIRESTDVTRMSAVFRENFFEAHREIVQAVSLKYIQQKCKLLEVGTGALDERNLSYLASLLPPDMQPNITYSDVNPNFKATVRHRSVPYETAGVVNLSQKLGEGSYDHILSCCVLDTLSEADTITGCVEAYKTLKPGGKLFLFSDLMPFQNTLFSHCNAENTIIFPLVGPDLVCHGVQLLDKTYLNQWLASQAAEKVPIEARKFFQALCQQTPLVRELFAVDIKNEKSGYIFSQYIKTIFGESLKVIFHKDFFASKMKNALSKAGFNIKEFGLRETSTNAAMLNKHPEFPNYFINSHGDAVAFKSYAIKPNTKIMHCKMHVIVAKKP